MTETNAYGFGFLGMIISKNLMLQGGSVRLCRICKFWMMTETPTSRTCTRNCSEKCM